MRSIHWAFITAICVVFAGCGGNSGEGPPASGGAPFIVMDESLTDLKEDFNAAAGTVRLLFLSGPTCGICLRGLADMDAELLGGNTDPRLRAFVVHVPTLDASREDARNSMALIDNPYTRHYWEDTGVIGRLYQEVMDMDIYLWDMWFIYGPGASWEKRLPPAPDYWMHQLGPLPDDKYLEADAFAARVREMLDHLPPPRETPVQRAAPVGRDLEIKGVAQPAGVALEQHIMGRGGFHNLDAMESVRMEGAITTSDGAKILVVTATRNGGLVRSIGSGDGVSVASRDDSGLVPPGAGRERGLPWSLERELMAAHEIAGPLVSWKKKGHSLDNSVDMVRIGDAMTWELDLVQDSGRHWLVYIDSHTGMERRRVLLDESNRPALEIRYSDYRVAEPDTPYTSRFPARKGRAGSGFFDEQGLVFPYRVEYRAPDGALIASEKYESIDVTFQADLE